MSYFTNAFIPHFLKRLEQLRVGQLQLITPEGKTYHYGESSASLSVTLQIHQWSMVWKTYLKGDIGLGESYMAGDWEVSDLYQFFLIILNNLPSLHSYAHGAMFYQYWFYVLNHFLRRPSFLTKAHPIVAHYDLNSAFYQLWLDESMTYSSGLFKDASATLEMAQHAKHQRILEKIQPAGKRVLDIGCGWGGFAEECATSGLEYTGLTTSNSQYQFAKKRLKESASIQLREYQHSKGIFDSVVAIEMFESIGQSAWSDFFKTIAARLRRGGIAMIQTITIANELFKEYRTHSDFLRHVIFPGGMLPSLERFYSHAQQAGLQCQEAFIFGHDYTSTLLEWQRRFEKNLEAIKSLGFEEEFIRKWRFYLSMCAAAFNVGRINVAQIELVHR